MPARCDVCVVGSANLDLVATTPRIPGPGETLLGTGYAEHAGGKGPRGPRGISAAAIEGATDAKASLDADKLAQPGPGLSDEARESNDSAGKTRPDAAAFQKASNANPDDFDEGEVIDR